ncbi:MAG: ribosome silencing factor [Desulfovibrionaceae bacterium]|nr:ribosome silencing factor [Desulfovibrionaceae bacterium]
MTEEKTFSTLPARDKAGVILAWLAEHKAFDMAAFHLAENPLAEVSIVVSASSARHARGLADGLLELCGRERYEFLRMEGYQNAMWVLADLNDIIVHIFQKSVRELYNLESLWHGAAALDLPDERKSRASAVPGTEGAARREECA